MQCDAQWITDDNGNRGRITHLVAVTDPADNGIRSSPIDACRGRVLSFSLPSGTVYACEAHSVNRGRLVMTAARGARNRREAAAMG